MMNRMTTGKVENPLHLSFRNPHWPPNMITPDNVLDYFCIQANHFYDMGSCNQQIRMQNINRPVEECLRTMAGIQYILWHAQPPLYIICKQRRNNINNVTPLAYYYVINGNIHQAPDMYSVVQSRLLGSLEPLRNAFQEVTNYLRYNTAKGYYWEFKGRPQVKREKKETEDDEEEKPIEERSTNFQKTRTFMLLDQLLAELPADEAIEPLELKPATATTSVKEKKAPVFAEPTGRGSGKSAANHE
ncbi:unnamed protein product [Caenorhabditis angaria]|uniref:Mediator of RNA polymerase II transcription subunit 6 n=1 Tax=Caenorhabditis angaria TaxID=860376 RepID=A0A9P1IWX7_9PELO|nr:unnamed protein product [Caenorhabditis angaria]